MTHPRPSAHQSQSVRSQSQACPALPCLPACSILFPKLCPDRDVPPAGPPVLKLNTAPLSLDVDALAPRPRPRPRPLPRDDDEDRPFTVFTSNFSPLLVPTVLLGLAPAKECGRRNQVLLLSLLLALHTLASISLQYMARLPARTRRYCTS